ncbi:hypothetical protein MNNICLKF_01877 [Synechococcus sp. CBW1107]|nr:hypothetical protein MNNICLKF_01877 [Synechococcus sp. CBW1107]
MLSLVILQLIRRNELSQLDRAIVTRDYTNKRREEVFMRELMMILTLIHVESLGHSWPQMCSFTHILPP